MGMGCQWSRSGAFPFLRVWQRGSPVWAAVGDQQMHLALGGEGRGREAGQVLPPATGELPRPPGPRDGCCGRRWRSGFGPGRSSLPAPRSLAGPAGTSARPPSARSSLPASRPPAVGPQGSQHHREGHSRPLSPYPPPVLLQLLPINARFFSPRERARQEVSQPRR